MNRSLIEVAETAPWYAVVAIVLSVTALVLTLKNYRRKSGMLVRGAFTIMSSVDCDDDFVSNITLENLKDRAITIFAIYLRVAYSYYVEIESFEDKPLLLKAFETYQKEYGPIQFYGSNMRQVRVGASLRDHKVRKRLVLSTGDGKYVVPSIMRKWSPLGEFFKNYMTALVRPIHAMHKGRYIGCNIKYVAEFVSDNNHEDIVLIRAEDHERKKFRNFALTRDSLESKEALEAFFRKQTDEGTIDCRSVVVYDTVAWREQLTEHYRVNATIHVEQHGMLRHYIVGRLLTWFHYWYRRRKNPKRMVRTDIQP